MTPHGQFKRGTSVARTVAKRSMLISALTEHMLMTHSIYSKPLCPIGPLISMQMKCVGLWVLMDYPVNIQIAEA